MKRIWFKPDCVKWILEGKKTTTFRSKKHEGEYEIVKGSRFKAEGLGIFLKLTPEKLPIKDENAVAIHFRTEGDFKSPGDFMEWLITNKLQLPEWGYLHKIDVINQTIFLIN